MIKGTELRKLRSRAMTLPADLKLGKAGLTPEFLASLQALFNHRDLVKIRLESFKEERKSLAPELARQAEAELVQLVGNVVVLYRAPA
jgi:RNA-binding protein